MENSLISEDAVPARVDSFDICELELEYSVQYLIPQKRNLRRIKSTFKGSISLVNNKDEVISSYQMIFDFPGNNTLKNDGLRGGVLIPQENSNSIRVVNDPTIPFQDIVTNQSREIFNFTGVKLIKEEVYALEGVSVNGLNCRQFPRCDVIFNSDDSRSDSGESEGSFVTQESTERSILGLLRCLRPTCPDFNDAILGAEDIEEDDSISPANESSEESTNAQASDLDLLTDLILDNQISMENATVYSCRVQYCCGSQQTPLPPPPPPPPAEYIIGGIIYSDQLAPEWQNESVNGTYNFQSTEIVNDGEYSIKAELGNGGIFRICTDSPIGRASKGHQGIQFWIYGGKEIGTLELNFEAFEEDISNRQEINNIVDILSPERDSDAIGNSTIAINESDSIVLSTISSLLVDEWNLFQIELPLTNDVKCISLFDSLGLEPTFFIDDMSILFKTNFFPPPPLNTPPPRPGSIDLSSESLGLGEDLTQSNIASNGRGFISETNGQSSSSNENGSTCGTGCILGIVFGAIFLICISAALVFFFYVRRNPKKRSGRTPSQRGLLSPLGRSFLSNGSSGSIGPFTPSSGVMNIDFEEEVVLEELIGSGGFGSVYKGTWRSAEVAIKLMYGVFENENSRELENFAQEVTVLSRLHHPHIIEFYGACLTPPHVCLVEELAVCSLYARLHDDTCTDKNVKGPFGTPLKYDDILNIADEIADALAYLHPSVVHRDLKSQNVLLDSNGRSKVCDFGIAKFKEKTFLTTKNVQAGTPAYMAPELFRAQEASEMVDVFSFGVLLWECFTGEIPWNTHSPLQVIFAITVEERRLPLPDSMPVFLRDLIHECWLEQPTARPKFNDILLRVRRERYGDLDDHDLKVPAGEGKTDGSEDECAKDEDSIRIEMVTQTNDSEDLGTEDEERTVYHDDINIRHPASETQTDSNSVENDSDGEVERSAYVDNI